jgi:soluble lytic murein transglycosylase-like protein
MVAAFIFNLSGAHAGSDAAGNPPAASRSQEGLGACEREMARAAQAETIPLAVLYSVGLTETGQRGRLQPYAMNVDGAAVASGSLPEALRAFQAARQRGAKFIDIGCMQINHRFHSSHFDSLEAMFDAHRNVAYAAHFLRELRAREPSWTLAVARYNAGPDNNYAQKKYVCAVIGNMVRSGFGGWTDAARKFCAPGGA